MTERTREQCPAPATHLAFWPGRKSVKPVCDIHLDRDRELCKAAGMRLGYRQTVSTDAPVQCEHVTEADVPSVR